MKVLVVIFFDAKGLIYHHKFLQELQSLALFILRYYVPFVILSLVNDPIFVMVKGCCCTKTLLLIVLKLHNRFWRGTAPKNYPTHPIRLIWPPAISGCFQNSSALFVGSDLPLKMTCGPPPTLCYATSQKTFSNSYLRSGASECKSALI